MKLVSTGAIALAVAALSTFAGAKASGDPTEVTKPEANIAEMTPGLTYFNRAGATMAEHAAAVRDCMDVAEFAHSRDDIIGNDRGIIGAMMTAGPKRGVYAAAVENCMIVRGWRVVQIPLDQGGAIAALPPRDIADAIAPWVGAIAPPHPIVRVWNNDAAHGETKRFEYSPRFVDPGSLSVIAVSGYAQPGKALPFKAPPKVKIDKKWLIGSLKPEQFAKAPAGSAILIAHIKGVSLRNGVSLTFMRVGENDETSPSVVDFALDSVMFGQSYIGANPDGRLMAFAVPPGRWRIAAMNIAPVLNFCLGAPSFEISAGEVVYAGSFDMAADVLTPDLSLDRARTFLAGAPAAETLRAANYVNGTMGPCGDSIVYALEFQGAPFMPGYAWGSLADHPELVVPGGKKPTRRDRGKQ